MNDQEIELVGMPMFRVYAPPARGVNDEFLAIHEYVDLIVGSSPGEAIRGGLAFGQKRSQPEGLGGGELGQASRRPIFRPPAGIRVLWKTVHGIQVHCPSNGIEES